MKMYDSNYAIYICIHKIFKHVLNINLISLLEDEIKAYKDLIQQNNEYFISTPQHVVWKRGTI